MPEVKTGLEGVVKFRAIAGTAAVDAGTALSYVTGFDYSWDENKKDVWNRATFAHYKKGRAQGKATAKMQYVSRDEIDVIKTAIANYSYPQCYIELQIDGISGTGADVVTFANAALDSHSFSQPEEDVDSLDLSFTFAAKPETLTYANRRIT